MKNILINKVKTFFSGKSLDSQDYYSGGWGNNDNGFGWQTDPNFSTHYLPRVDLSHDMLFYLYESNPLIRRFVNLWKGDATRKGFTLIDKDNAELTNKIETDLKKRFSIDGILSKAVGIEKLYGGGIIFADIDDGNDPKDPLNINAVKKINSLQTIEKEYCIPVTWDDLIGTETPGEPIHYRVQLLSGNKTEQLIVHKSRVIRIPEMKLDDNLSQIARQKRFTWPVSPTQNAYDSAKRYGIGLQSFSQHLQNMVVDILKISDLSKINDKESFKKYIKNQLKTKSSMKMTILGADDDLNRIGTPLAGIESIIAAVEKDVSMAFGIPLSILFSNESGALGGSTISGDRAVWFDQVKSYQNNILTHAITRIVELWGYEQSIDTDKITVSFNSLYEESEIEEMNKRKLAFESDSLLVGMGYPASEIFNSRFSGDKVDYHSFNYDQKEIEDFINDSEEPAEQGAERSSGIEQDNKE